ncbi:uracil DNA glycosylase [Agyrium rufum]|nr:uracil DNA glycosylase [Agyrium rufum]
MATAVKRKATDIAATTAKKPKADASITSFFGAPKSISTSTLPSKAQPGNAASTPVSKWNKEAWVEKLTDEQKDLLKLEIDTLDESWLAHLKDEILTKDFLELKRFLKKEKESGKIIYPPLPEVYSWSRHTPLHSVKALIVGQDPYHNVNQAHGLCFSVRPPTPAPPSLKNIYIALKKDYPTFSPPPKNGGLLTPWADRGVLMLNTCLTVRAHEPNSHAGKGWEKFTQKVIDTVVKVRLRGIVILAWGKAAKDRAKQVDKKKHCVLESVHPSPFSAANGFFDCGHFKKANVWLKGRYGDEGEIDWNLDVPPGKAGV